MHFTTTRTTISSPGQRWRVEQSPDGLRLWLDDGVGTETDLGVVTSKRTETRAAKAAGHAVATFDSHPLLDPFAQLWNLATSQAHHSVDAPTLSPAAQHVRDRETQATTVDAAIGNALSSLSLNRISALKTGASSQRLLVFKVKGPRLSGWARALGRRGCPHCEAITDDGGHTLHIVRSCPAARVVWLLLLKFWQRLGLWRHATVETGSFLSAVLSIRLHSTPAGVVPFASIPDAPADPDALHDPMQSVWERQVLAGFQMIWAWHQGAADPDLPWTYTVV